MKSSKFRTPAVLVAMAAMAMPMFAFAQDKSADQLKDEAKSREAANSLRVGQPKAAEAKQINPAQPNVTPPGALPDALTMGEKDFSWGDISDTDPVSHDITFTNVSDKTITIAVAASCGCTVAQLEKNTFAPGESGKATATFNPHGRTGPQTKTLTFTVTNPQGVFAQQMVNLTANVKALVTFDPPKMYLNEVDHRKGQTAKLLLTGRKPGFAVTKATAQSEFVTVTVGEPTTIESGADKLTQVPIELLIGKGAPIGNFQTNLMIETNDEKAKLQPYYLGADVVGDVKATPPQAILRVNTPNSAFNTQVRLDSRSGSSFNLISVDTEGPADMKVVADITKGEEGTYYMINMSGVTPNRGGMVQGFVVVTTDAQGGETMKIPYTAVLRNPEQGAPAMAPTPITAPIVQPASGH